MKVNIKRLQKKKESVIIIRGNYGGDAKWQISSEKKIDHPLGRRQPEHPETVYGLNYGYVYGISDGDLRDTIYM